MNKILKQIISVLCVLIITFSFIVICQKLFKRAKIDITEQKLYTLCDGSKKIIAKLNQPIKMKLYYASTAAMQAPDNIKYFNNYYEYVKSLLEEYVAASNGMITLDVIDPRPYSDDEVNAIRYGLKRFAITEEEGFFFGLVLQTQFGVEKTIQFFSPDRQNFIEYDISYLIDTAITRQKKTVGILSSLEVNGQDLSPYMMRMMQMQGQQPKQPWAIVEQLKEQYDVKTVSQDVNEIEDVDILLVVHPKDLSEKCLFAIDQYILKGGKAIVCIDPYCFADTSAQQAMQYQQMPDTSSNLEKLLAKWGIEMPKMTFAGDRALAVESALRQGQRPQKIIGFLNLNANCFNHDTVATSELNEVRMLFSGVLKELTLDEQYKTERNIQRIPLAMTTQRGNSWTISSPYEMMMLDPQRLMKNFTEGTQPVNMAYMLTGRFDSAFPDGIELPPADANDPNSKPTHIEGLTEAKDDCAVIVFADVDFISDMLAYSKSFFGTMAVADNSTLLLNSVDDLSGSSELVSIRSRGNFKRPFEVVDKIEAKAEEDAAEEEAKINAQIDGFQSELQSIIASAGKEQQQVIGSSILQKKKEIELKIAEAKKRLWKIKMQKRQSKEALGNELRNFNMLTAPVVSLVIAVVLAIYRASKKRKYISHASDA